MKIKAILTGVLALMVGFFIFYQFLPAGIASGLGVASFLPVILNNRIGPLPTPTATPPPIPTPLPGTYDFWETYDGDPAQPTSWNPTNWDVTVHSRDTYTLYSLDGMDAKHGTECDAPPATHYIDQYEDSVYNCKNHMMTAINASGYGLIYLTPNQIVDFSNETAIIQFDMSTERFSIREWVDIWITPYDQNLQLPLETWLPDLSGQPKNALHIKMDGAINSFRAYNIVNFQASEIPGLYWIPYDDFLEPSPSRRDKFELHISATHLKFGMPDYDFWWIDEDIEGGVDWTQGIVQIGHHSYNPEKACDYDGSCGPNTWHWDNVTITPAIPFTIIPADRRYVNPEQTIVNFASPAPANAHLRFAGIGDSIEVSFNGGNTWQAAQLQMQAVYHSDKFSSYWMPVPEGTTQVRFRGEDWWGGDWHARDISIWSLVYDGEQKPVGRTSLWRDSLNTNTTDTTLSCAIPITD